MNRYLFFILSAVLVTACSPSKQVATSQANATSGQEITENKRADNPELEALFWARRDSTKLHYIQADVDFMAGMIGHHAQALIMSSLAEPNGASQSVQTLAARIINAQRDEIRIMQQWLSDRDETVPQVKIVGLNLIITPGSEPLLDFTEQAVIDGLHENMGHEGHGMGDMPKERPEEMQDKMEKEFENSINRSSDMAHMADNGMGEEDHSKMDHSMMHDHSGMPGMLSQIQLEELAAAKGKHFDRLFLRYMIQHHAGAITMVNELVETDGAVQDVSLGKLAGDINVDQKTEIERMRLMLMQMIEAENGE